MKKIYYLYNVIFLFLSSNIIAQPNKDSINEVVELIDKVINWQNQQTDHIKKYTLTNWQFATNYIGMMKAFKTTGNIAYQNYLKKIGEDHKWQTIPDMYHADKIAISQVYLDLYKQLGEEELIKNTKWVLDANLIRNKPEPDVRYNNNPYKHEWWSWCDALFMAPPTFAKMYEITGVSLKYCEFLLNNHHLVDTYIQEVVEEKKKVVSMLKHYEVIDSNCNWIHFNNQDDNKETKEIFDKHKVLVKYCKVHPYGFRDNWCRITIQPGLSEQEFFKELVNG